MRTLSQIKLPAVIDNLAKFIGPVSQCAGEQGFSKERISQIHLAMEEVLMNVMNYSYQGQDEPGDAEVTCSLNDDNRFVIEVVDTGVPFDLLSSQDPDITLQIDERKIGGLGIFIVKKLMDSVAYRREENKNILTLIVDKKEE
jgi:anti-sigma regulatory factor (Ser/Thr protein kinase)